MHELPITESILEIAVRHGEQANAARVTDLYLVIGQLSSIVDDSIQFYWDIISRDTICEGATLHFERVPAQLLCLDCGHSYGFDYELSACPICDSTHIKVAAGEEFQLQSIEIETNKEIEP
ncbi:MAG: hydrogenase maturation nickel metallochaperone HypA [Ardenticatenaceae bacterium]|nr:hydrogenase maturation nickel metallochaperone HypA [Ardenticatenaceae bacterium]MCB9442961.1 hydrogenase maturation nickel metallochaperone HypA [Ardenticatenaceae bacterium]